MTATRDQIAQETAEYIASDLMPRTTEFHGYPWVTVHYADDQRPPTTVAEIKASLLDNRLWFSWMDDRVFSAMRAIHNGPKPAVPVHNPTVDRRARAGRRT